MLILLSPPTSKMRPDALTSELDPHDRLLDALIDHIHNHTPTEPELPTWALEALAGGLGLDALITDPADPKTRLATRTDVLLDALDDAIHRPGERALVLRPAVTAIHRLNHLIATVDQCGAGGGLGSKVGKTIKTVKVDGETQ